MKYVSKHYLVYSVFCIASLGLLSAHGQPQPPVQPAAYVATAWADMTVQTMTGAMKNTPTYGSRALGYLGLAMHESLAAGTRKHRSIARSLCDTLRLPVPNRSLTYCPELALNAGQAYLLTALYRYTRHTERIDSLADAIHRHYAARYSPQVVARSERFGLAVAEKLYQWSLTDGGHQAQERNFPVDYVVLTGTGCWTVPLIGQAVTKVPMHPYWGTNRLFVRQNGQLPIPRPLPFSTDSASEFYQQNQEVWHRNQQLTSEERATVLWWGDDPNLTCSPPGHSYYLATAAIRQSQADLAKAAQTYCRVGLAVADAFVVCWKVKFTHLVERPSSYVASVMQPPTNTRWYPFFPEPPFPSFYSGHAVQSAATATVLTDLYGDAFTFTDDLHVGRPALRYYLYLNNGYTQSFTPRTYPSFWAAARECAESRLLGGIHTRQDNEVGLQEGAKIGAHVNNLPWR